MSIKKAYESVNTAIKDHISPVFLLGVSVLTILGALFGPSLLDRPNLQCVAQSVDLTPTDIQAQYIFNMLATFMSPKQASKANDRLNQELHRFGFTDKEIAALKNPKSLPPSEPYKAKRYAYALNVMTQDVFFDPLAKSMFDEVMPPGGVILVHIENQGRGDAQKIKIHVTCGQTISDVVVQCPSEPFKVDKGNGEAWITLDRLTNEAKFDAVVWLGRVSQTTQDEPKVNISLDGRNIEVPVQPLGPGGQKSS
jgi:hypothetical protein